VQVVAAYERGTLLELIEARAKVPSANIVPFAFIAPL
jgi:hypothetical protein